MGTGKLVGLMAAYVIVGFPLVWYLWETLNQLLAAEVEGSRLLLSVPVFLVLVALLVLLARSVQRWDRADTD